MYVAVIEMWCRIEVYMHIYPNIQDVPLKIGHRTAVLN